MKKNFLKGAALVAIALVGFSATAQEEATEAKAPSFDLSGSVDTYFRANINGNVDGDDPDTSFADKDGFSVGMINLILSKQIGKVGFVGDVVAGPRGNAAISEDNSERSEVLINQAYVTYAANESLTFTLGRFNTFLGYEVISPAGNFNYTTSQLFSNGPFSHNGLKADYAIDENWSVMGAIMNQTDVTFGNTNGKYTAGLQLGYSNEKGSAYLNTTYGRQGIGATENTFQIDLTTGWDFSEDLYVGLNASVQNTKDDEGFYGVALYPQYALSDDFSVGLRGEYFVRTDDSSNGKSDDQTGSITLTGSYTTGSLTIKPELRLDEDEDKFNADLKGDTLASFILGAIYSF